MMIGSVKVSPWQPYVRNTWERMPEDWLPTHYARGWLVGLTWSPPKGGDWDKLGCQPCQKVIWNQDAAKGKGSQFYTEINDSNYSKYGYAWDATKSGSTGAATFDEPDQHGDSVWAFQSPYSFYAKSYAKCVAGKDAGKIYATVLWGFTWTYDTTPTGLGPIIE
jgi:hypothetical protein